VRKARHSRAGSSTTDPEKAEREKKRAEKQRENIMEKFAADEIYGLSEDKMQQQQSHIGGDQLPHTVPVPKQSPMDSRFGRVGDFVHWLAPRGCHSARTLHCICALCICAL